LLSVGWDFNMINLSTESEVSMFTYYKNIKAMQNVENGVVLRNYQSPKVIGHITI